MAHTCHAAACEIRVPPEMFMCRKHWFSLPKRLRDAIWRTYRSGQCDDWAISHDYAETAKEAVTFVATKERRDAAELAAALQVYEFLDPERAE